MKCDICKTEHETLERHSGYMVCPTCKAALVEVDRLTDEELTSDAARIYPARARGNPRTSAG